MAVLLAVSRQEKKRFWRGRHSESVRAELQWIKHTRKAPTFSWALGSRLSSGTRIGQYQVGTRAVVALNCAMRP